MKRLLVFAALAAAACGLAGRLDYDDLGDGVFQVKYTAIGQNDAFATSMLDERAAGMCSHGVDPIRRSHFETPEHHVYTLRFRCLPPPAQLAPQAGMDHRIPGAGR